ncbi:MULTISPECIES: hypothetical protein [unclassified Streptomyces]|uniref:hypothetical protein n=1 Tax=unclassified Streptomyces TaxID=2593676 RepID=UPI001660C839|nr:MULTISPECIES: hypothetical protein [unclassified Streptomyces]MBD0707229.1 hypothetical protein [Streptomyces sp. CBMA291]MBD0713717.1 hypothetical protein [Streptomyces sp. CBMA370]
MTGGNQHFGDVVNINGGDGHTGIVHHHHAPGLTPEQAEALVAGLARALRGEVPAGYRDSIDEALPALAEGASVAPAVRRRSLRALETVAVGVGTIGQPLLEAVRTALDLFKG